MTNLFIFAKSFFFFFFNDTATTEIYTLSLHDALPIYCGGGIPHPRARLLRGPIRRTDRKSTRLNSSHTVISYAVFCLKKKKKHYEITPTFGRLTQRLECYPHTVEV